MSNPVKLVVYISCQNQIYSMKYRALPRVRDVKSGDSAKPCYFCNNRFTITLMQKLIFFNDETFFFRSLGTCSSEHPRNILLFFPQEWMPGQSAE
jgi:hypothetical protein